MPIYEFLCPDCNTIYKFFSRTVNTEKRPACPGCLKGTLQRRMSLFAAISGGKSDSSDEGGMDDLPIDESKMTHAMEKLAGEAQNMNEGDPRAAAKLMQKLSSMTGLKYNDSIQEALSRMEAGEDPDQIEAQMGDALGEDGNPFKLPGKKGGSGPKPLSYDDTLYEM